MENTLKALAVTQISTAILAATGLPPALPNTLAPLAEGIANAIIPFLTANVLVTIPAGVPVATAGGPAAQTGATTAPGLGTIS